MADIETQEELSAQPARRVAVVAPVPYWSYLIPVVTALIATIQVLGLAYIGVKMGDVKQGVAVVSQKVDEGKQATTVLEKQINSNLEKQIKQAIAEALAVQALHFNEEREKAKKK